MEEYIKNLWDELPSHLTEQEKKLFNEVKEALLTYKGKLRGIDYRLSAIVMCKHMEGSFSRYVIRDILYTLAQLCHLLYLQEHERSPKLNLRLHNTAYRHAMLCKKVVGIPRAIHLRAILWSLLALYCNRSTNFVSNCITPYHMH